MAWAEGISVFLHTTYMPFIYKGKNIYYPQYNRNNRSFQYSFNAKPGWGGSRNMFTKTRWKGNMSKKKKQASYKSTLLASISSPYLLDDKKFVDKFVATTTIAAAGTWTFIDDGTNPVNGMVQGDAVGERIGNRISMQYMTYKMILFINPLLADVDLTGIIKNVVRIIVILDKRSNLGAFAATDALDVSSDEILSNYKIEFSKRFVILHDQVYKLNLGSPNWDGTDFNAVGDTKHIAFTVGLNNAIVQYKAGAGTAGFASIQSGAIRVLATVGSGGGGSMPAVGIRLQTRLRFKG